MSSKSGAIYNSHFTDDEIGAQRGKFLALDQMGKWPSISSVHYNAVPSPAQWMATIVNFIIVLSTADTPHCICSIFNLGGWVSTFFSHIILNKITTESDLNSLTSKQSQSRISLIEPAMGPWSPLFLWPLHKTLCPLLGTVGKYLSKTQLSVFAAWHI